MDFDDRRRHRRHDVRLQVQIAGSTVGQCWSRDLSRGGIFLETAQVLALDQTIELVVQASGSFPELHAQGTVVHAEAGRGYGVRFDAFSVPTVAGRDWESFFPESKPGSDSAP